MNKIISIKLNILLGPNCICNILMVSCWIVKPLENNSVVVWSQVLLLAAVGPESQGTTECLHCWMSKRDESQQQYSAVHRLSQLTWLWLSPQITSVFVCPCMLGHYSMALWMPASRFVHHSSQPAWQSHNRKPVFSAMAPNFSLWGRALPSTRWSIN